MRRCKESWSTMGRQKRGSGKRRLFQVLCRRRLRPRRQHQQRQSVDSIHDAIAQNGRVRSADRPFTSDPVEHLRFRSRSKRPGRDELALDQRQRQIAPMWTSLGTFDFDATSSGRRTISQRRNQRVCDRRCRAVSLPQRMQQRPESQPVNASAKRITEAQQTSRQLKKQLKELNDHAPTAARGDGPTRSSQRRDRRQPCPHSRRSQELGTGRAAWILAGLQQR